MFKVRLNLKKMIAIAICLAVSSVMFTSCGQAAKSKKVDSNPVVKQVEVDLSCQDDGVVINGVKWATRNVAAPGTFAAKPENVGMFYQWNRKVAWAATGDVTNWNSSLPIGTTWKKSNDPSPTGWRVPTFDEIKTLLDIEKVSNEWAIVNGVNGRKFTDKISGKFLFLPAAGIRDYDGTSIGAGSGSDYWSSTALDNSDIYAYYLDFGSESAGYSYTASRIHGFQVRCVAE